MSVDLKAQQLRIRIRNPKRFSKFRIHDVGRKGRLQRVAAFSRATGWKTQAWRLNLKGYKNFKEVVMQLSRLKISDTSKARAKSIAKKFYKKKKTRRK